MRRISPTLPKMNEPPQGTAQAREPSTDAADVDRRQADGFLLLDKPTGLSSFQALRPVKRLFKGRKVGHAGTLDPGASGLLLVGIGAGTRLLEHLEGMPKTYSFAARFGSTSDSYDMDGVLTVGDEDARRIAAGLTPEAVQAALRPFRGAIRQVPPDYSAIKIQGKRACDRVRDGETVTLAARDVFVHALELTGWEAGPGPAEGPIASLLLTCSKGTYVRSLVHDLGAALGCGAVTDKIRRLAIGPFRVEDAVAAEAPEAPLLPLATAVQHLPAARLAPAGVAAFLNGMMTPPGGYSLEAPVIGPAAAEGADERPPGVHLTHRVLDPQGRLLALATVDAEGRLCPKKVLARE
jgi:tRNA pseudouridine55 synthase